MSRDKDHVPDNDDTMVPGDRAAQGASAAADDKQSEGSEAQPAETQLAEAQQKLLRALADGENLRRQARRGQEEARRFAISDFAADLLATADTLELALTNVPEARRADPALAPLVEGIEATRRMLLAAFSKHGISRSDPLGESFDPNFHEAGFRTHGTGDPPDTVTEVVRPGYALHGRVLRPALVGVASTTAEGAGQGASEAPSAEGKASADRE